MSGVPLRSNDDDDSLDEIDRLIWQLDTVELTTVGIDVGSSTSHVMFAHLVLRRQADSYSSRFEVTSRKDLYRSPALLTPYLDDSRIDVARLREFIDAAYAEAGVLPDDIDTGAVILTGTALERVNSEAIADVFARDGGRFVCATAGHNLEALLAAHGSGAVGLSTADGTTPADVVLNVDIGGGTTKLALAVDGQVIATSAISAGARLVAFDRDGQVTRLEPTAVELATEMGIPLALGHRLSDADRRRLVAALANRVVEAVAGRPDVGWLLTEELPVMPRPNRLLLSGGVAQYIGAVVEEDHGDLGRDLAAAVSAGLESQGLPLVVASDPIRATVVGASQYSVQVSGNTITVGQADLLPMRNVPVVAVDLRDTTEPQASVVGDRVRRAATRLDLDDSDRPLAVAVRWTGTPSHANLWAIASGIHGAHQKSPRRATVITIALEADLGASLGAILADELGADTGVVAIDGLRLADLDFIDIGEQIQPTNVVPVVIKSLLFPGTSTSEPAKPAKGEHV